MIVDVNAANFSSEVLDGPGRTVVQFHAEWCGPCRALTPHFVSAAEDAGDVKWVRADVDQLDRSTIQEYSIMSIPRMILFEDGKPVKDITGRTKYKILEEVNG